MGGDDRNKVMAALRAAGCLYVRSAKGSHELWYSPHTGRKFTVPRTVSRATANNIMKQAGLERRF